MVEYGYNAWGELLFTTGSMASTLGVKNPIRYRGYYYDSERGFYYLNSRYYDPFMCRFINADGYVSTGQGLTSFNMFAYCGNNPVNRADPEGESFITAIIPVIVSVCKAIEEITKCISGGVGAAAPYKRYDDHAGFTEPNCYSYAIGYEYGWLDPGDLSSPFTSYSVEDVALAVQNDMAALKRGCRPIKTYNSPINSNEYRIALRVKLLKDCTILQDEYVDWDYHFMVQTATGRWAEKHGEGATEYHLFGNPDTISWDLGDEKGYYDSHIIYFAITNWG